MAAGFLTLLLVLLFGVGNVATAPVHHVQARPGIRALRPLLHPGSMAAFPRGRARPGDLVVCSGHGVLVTGRVPTGNGSVVYPRPPLKLLITRRGSGAVVAVCR